jgi:4-hydroxy-tetrahydrodipicolinate synthase
LTTHLDGIHFMLPTPFTHRGDVDLKSFANLSRYAHSAGCAGVVALGVLGEAHRLSDAERSDVLDAVMSSAGKSLAVTVGISAESGRVAAERAREAQSAGAAAVMAAPARMAKPNEQAVMAYYADIQAAIDIPIVVQDLPEQSSVHMSPEFIARLSTDLPGVKYLKLEDPPTPPKVTRVIAATHGRVGVFGGLGGAFLFEELRRGAIGTMTGFAYPEVLVAVHRHMKKGETQRAREVFYKWLPLIRYEASAGIGLSIRKHILHRRGFIETPDLRPPGPAIDAPTLEELDDILCNMDLNTKGL